MYRNRVLRCSALAFKDQVLPVKVAGSIPGPKSIALKEEYQKIGGGGGTVSLFQDVARSSGNYFVDADGNVLLDVFGHIATVAVGYNHPKVAALAKSEAMQHAVINRCALGLLPPHDYVDLLKSSLMKVAPPGMTSVITLASGTDAVENAMKCAFFVKMGRTREKSGRGFVDFNEEESKSTMLNMPPGSPEICAMSFMGGFHGRALGALSLSRSKVIHKIDAPAFKWPAAPFPKLQYPLKDFKAENQQEEARCLTRVRELIQVRKKENCPIATIIVEPIQSEGGDQHASDDFFRSLRKICEEEEIIFIVDEVQTGLACTGYMWCHERWNLDNPPDIVTFSKKAQIGGFYLKSEIVPTLPYRVFNTWMGDAVRTLHCATILDIIREEKMIDTVKKSGPALLETLEKAQAAHPSKLMKARGAGTFCAFDCPTASKRDDLVNQLKNNGVMIGGCGDTSIRLRPALCFGTEHVKQFEEILMKVLKA